MIGCDPGADGAFYELVREGAVNARVWRPLEYLPMPMIDVGKKYREVDVPAILDWLLTRGPIALLAVEKVGYMPADKLGRKNSGFGDAILVGRVKTIVAMLQTINRLRPDEAIPYEQPSVQEWHGAAAIKVPRTKGEPEKERKKKIKAAVVDFCRRRYPRASLIPPGCKVAQDGLADAVGIAHWASLRASGLI